MDELTKLAIAARDGNKFALNQFIRRTQPEVWRLCANLGARVDADDLTQEVYAAAFRALPRFRGDSSARTWLLSIARNRCVDYVRSATRKRRLASLVGKADVEQLPDTSIDIRSMFSVLDTNQRSAFVMTQLLGLSYEEAASASECPVGTIRSRVARARSRLIEAYENAEITVTG